MSWGGARGAEGGGPRSDGRRGGAWKVRSRRSGAATDAASIPTVSAGICALVDGTRSAASSSNTPCEWKSALIDAYPGVVSGLSVSWLCDGTPVFRMPSNATSRAAVTERAERRIISEDTGPVRGGQGRTAREGWRISSVYWSMTVSKPLKSACPQHQLEANCGLVRCARHNMDQLRTE
jgi:hypothetical protein